MKTELPEVFCRIKVDALSGLLYWIDATKHHIRLNGKEAGCKRRCSGKRDKFYWYVKFNGQGIKRSHIVFAFVHGRWPSLQIDHINGDSLDDKIENLREATCMQNAWNHKGRRKTTPLPMGSQEAAIRKVSSPYSLRS